MSYTTQYTHQKDLRQAISFSLSGTHDSICKSALSEFPKKEQSVMNHVFGAADRLKILTFSYDTMARDLRVSYNTVYRAIHKMTKLGFITRVTRLTNTCIITVNPIIYDLAEKLKHKYFYLKRIALRNLVCSSSRNEEPLREIFISKPCKYMYQLLDSTKGVCSRGMTLLKNKLKERRIEVDEVGALVISATLRDITEKLRLTKLGQLKLMAFSDDVLRVVWGSFRSAKSPKSPFDWMIVACEQYSVANKIPVDWQIYYALLKRYNVTDNKVYIRKQETEKTYQVNAALEERVPRWKQFVSTVAHPEFAKYFEQKITNDGL